MPPISRSHKTGVGDLLGGGLPDNQIPVREALRRLKALLEDRPVLKVAQNLKYDYLAHEATRHQISELRRHNADVLRVDAGNGSAWDG
ncbi:hypothetical protein [Ensifer canadensis]